MSGAAIDASLLAAKWEANKVALSAEIAASESLRNLSEGMFYAGAAGMYEIMLQVVSEMDELQAMRCLQALDIELTAFSAKQLARMHAGPAQ